MRNSYFSSETYGYSAANRLNAASGLWGALTYGYDGVGNRTSEALTAGGTTTWTYAYPPANNKLSTVTEGSNVRTFTHDAAGNVTADDRTGTAFNYRYNNRGRLDRLTIGTTVTADYTYDGLERLALRTTQNMTPAGTTHYVYDLSGRLIAEATDTGQTLREYIWLDDMPLAVIADVDTATPKLWFVHPDHIDRPVKMTDGTQAVVWDAIWRPFGAVHSITGSATNNLRFPGQYFLIESGLHYNWHRHYDPTIGRYLQADPTVDSFDTVPSVGTALSQQLRNSPWHMYFRSTTDQISPRVGYAVTRMDASVPPNSIPIDRPMNGSTFVDGPSLYAYVQSKPTINTDPKGLLTGPFTRIPGGSMANACAYGQTKHDRCVAKCLHLLLQPPSGDLQSTEYRTCYRKCMGRL